MRSGKPITRRQFGTVATGMATGLAGCIGSFGNSGNSLIIWGGDIDTEQWDEWRSWYTNQLDDAFEESVDLSTFSYEDMRDNFLVGARQGEPHMLEGLITHLFEYNEGDLISPYEKSDIDHFDGFLDSATDPLTIDGELYGLPFWGNARGLLYREDVLEEYGLELPETWEEYIDVTRTISTEDDEMWGTHYTTQSGSVRAFQEWISHYFQLEDSVFVREDGNWSVSAEPDTLSRVYGLYDKLFEGNPSPVNPDDRGTGSGVHDEGYSIGDYAMIPGGPWIKSGMDDTVLENTQSARLPRPEEGRSATYLEVKPLMVNSHTGNQEAAMQAASMWTSPESIERMVEAVGNPGLALVRDDVEAEYEESFQEFEEIFEEGIGLDPVPWGETQQVVTEEMEQLIYDEKDPQEAGEDLHESLVEIANGFNE